jgi:hypothetical protein
VRDGAVPCLLCVVRVGCRPAAGGAAPRRRWAWSARPSPRRRRPTWCRSGGTERSPATRSTVGHAKARHASQRMRQPVQVEKGTAAGVGGQPSCRRTPALGAVADSCGAAIGGTGPPRRVPTTQGYGGRARRGVLTRNPCRALAGARHRPLRGSVLAVGAYRTARHRRLRRPRRSSGAAARATSSGPSAGPGRSILPGVAPGSTVRSLPRASAGPVPAAQGGRVRATSEEI